jgi:hypothetical protein
VGPYFDEEADIKLKQALEPGKSCGQQAAFDQS